MGYYDKERVRGFLHNQDGIIVNDFGEEVILRGWGMGNWDNPEGFMLGTQSGFGPFEPGKYAPMGRMDRGRSMDQILRETCGTKYAEEFWKRWRRLYLTEEDIALLSRRGYNSVRLPIRAGSFLYEEPGITYNEDSFAMLNDVLDWCETYQVYAVVDFHAATAGQSGIPCDDGVDNGQHLYDDEESMERMFLLMEEFMRRYKDRWIIGAYDCINEPISMTPRREELTPKLVYFYEEMIRRCRKIDQKHLFLLNGTQFSSLTYFFDHEFDPEYHNWGISLHAYEMVVPEVASLASVLRTCREQKICLWMGETGGRNEHAWQTTMYEILAEYHAGYNLWCWKTVEGAGCASILNFNVPDEWHLIMQLMELQNRPTSMRRPSGTATWNAWRSINAKKIRNIILICFERAILRSRRSATTRCRWIHTVVLVIFRMLQDIVCMTGLNWFMKKDIILNRPGLPHRVRSNIREIMYSFSWEQESMLPIQSVKKKPIRFL